MTQQQFANGGVIQTSTTNPGGLTISAASSYGPHITIQGNVGNMSAALAKTTKAMKKLNKVTWKLEQVAKERNYCNNRRGGPASKIFCEVPKDVPHPYHSGRGRTGNWFSWKDKEWD